MAATVEGVSAGYNGDVWSSAEGVNHSYTYTVPAATEYVIGAIGLSTNRTVTAFTLDGNSLTSLVAMFGDGSGRVYQHPHYEITPSTGSSLSVAYTLSSTTTASRSTISAIIALSGVDTSPTTSTTAASDTSNPSHSITTAVGDLVIGILYRERDEAVTTDNTGSGVTEHLNYASAIGDVNWESRMVIASTVATSTSTSLSWTATARDWTITMLAFTPSATGTQALRRFTLSIG